MSHLSLVYREPEGDRLSRLGIRLSLLCFFFPGVIALSAHLSAKTVGWLPYSPQAHAHGMVLGFAALFVLALLFRIIPRGRTDPLPRHLWAASGLCSTAAACLVGYLGLTLPWLPIRWITGALWAGALIGIAGSLGACFQGRGPAGLWWDDWLSAGLASMGVTALILSFATFCEALDIVAHAPRALLWGALCPIAVGLTPRMIPALGDVGTPDRNEVLAASRHATMLSVLLTIAVLLNWSPLIVISATALTVLYVRVFRATAMLRLATPDTMSRISEPAPAARTLRWMTRAAWLSMAASQAVLIPGHLLPLIATQIPLFLSKPVISAWSSTLVVLGYHLLGLGFIIGMVLAVGQRVIPAWLAEDIRWPLLRPAVGILWLCALIGRIAAELVPEARGLLLHAALWLLVTGVLLFVGQIMRSMRPRGVSDRSGCPHAPTRSM